MSKEKLKVVTVVGTRPEIIRLAEVIKACDKSFNHIFVHTGQNWDTRLCDIFFTDFKLRKPDYFLNAVGNHLGETIGNIISKTYEVLQKEKPDALLILGDTNSALSAIAAKRLKIPIFHMEAGNRCFDQNVPEEINRKIVDHISDVNLPYTEHSRRYLLDEGLKKEFVFVTGSPMAEVIANNLEEISSSKVLASLNLKKQGYFLVSAHREENIDNEQNCELLVKSINAVAEFYQIPIVFSTHPRTRNIIQKRSIQFHSLIQNLEPFGFHDYCNLQKNAYCVLSDSGTLSEETAMLDFPGVLIRTSTERPEVIDEGNIIVAGIRTEGILQAISIVKGMTRHVPSDYMDKHVSQKVVAIIQSYTAIIRKRVWGID